MQRAFILDATADITARSCSVAGSATIAAVA
jgi:hypothetical protein